MKTLNKFVVESRIFKEFLKESYHEKLFSQYKREPTPQNQKKLEEAFQKFSRKIIAISYLRKVIHYESRNFDKKIRNEKKKELLILNQPIENDLFLIDLFEDEGLNQKMECEISNDIKDHLMNHDLLKAIKSLTPKQKEVLYLYFVKELKDVEIAKKMKVSQQAVSKLRNKALQKLKEEILCLKMSLFK